MVPTFAAVCAYGASPGQIDLNRVMVVDAERDISFHKPLPVTAKVTADSTVSGVFDKGKDKGAVIQRQTVVKDGERREARHHPWLALRARRRRLWRSDRRPARAASGADRAPDLSVDITDAAGPGAGLSAVRRPQSAALRSRIRQARRLPGADPARHVHLRHHLPRVLQTYADYDPAAFKQHAVRFSSPVYPGETVTMDMWKDGNVISFEAKVKARNVTVIKSGQTVLG